MPHVSHNSKNNVTKTKLAESNSTNSDHSKLDPNLVQHHFLAISYNLHVKRGAPRVSLPPGVLRVAWLGVTKRQAVIDVIDVAFTVGRDGGRLVCDK